MADRASGERLVEFLDDMRLMREECGWKRQQTHRSLARYLLEETHETLEAIDSGDTGHLCEELGDLLLQVYFHAAIAEETGEFTLDDVVAGIIEKMRRRNPHVFGSAEDRARGGDAAAVNEVWQSIKAQEKGRTSVTDGLPPGLPALLYADKVLDRLAREGNPPPSPLPPLVEEVAQHTPLVEEVAQRTPLVEEVAQQPSRNQGDPGDDLGDRLLALVAEARETGIDPEQALRDAVRRLLTSP